MKRRDELLVGLLLLVAIVLAFTGSIWIARGGLKSGYPMYARFAWGAGLKPGQQVLLAGIQIGFIEHVELIPDGTISVRMAIENEFGIPVGTTASVEPSGIFGDQLIALTPIMASTNYLTRGDTIPTGPGAAGLDALLQKGDTVISNVQHLTDRIRTEYVEGGGIDDTHRLITDLTKLVAQLSSIATEQSRQLSETQAGVRKVIASVDSVRIDSTLARVNGAAANLEQLSAEMRETNRQLQRVATLATDGNGTVARLLNDPAVFARMDTVLARIDSLTQDLKRNPRKYINLRIF